ncbi:MAG: hypothetical protein KGI47_10150 [Betaproteobacteria bacterium]|nr:hypothetical protein [Betaproteobacteria bacterium]MDE2621864.1 hypothetical protein [Betaproteobacteria bacterium]
MKMMTRYFTLMAALMMLGGCVPRSYQEEPQFGQTVRENRAIQTVNPKGIPPSGPVALDGTTAKAAMDRYISTFITPPPPVNVFSIGVGASGSAPMTVPSVMGTSPY